MATAVKQRRGNTSEHGSFTGLEAEITVNTETKTIHVHDGSTAGGIPLAKASDVSTVATAVTTVDAGSDTTMFPLLTTDATGNLAPKTDASGLTYNSTNGILTATIFSGNLSGGTADVTSVSTTAATGLLFTNSTSNSIQIPDDKTVGLSIVDSGGTTHLTFNTSSNTIITARPISFLGGGAFTGTSSKVLVANSDADTDFPVPFHDESNSLKDDTGTFTYNPSGGLLKVPSITATGTVTANAFSGNATSSTIAKGAAVIYDASNDGAIGHATVAGFVGKTVVYTNTVNGDDLTLGLPDVGVDIQIGEQIHLINASTGDGATANIILHLDESGTQQKTNTCTGAIVVVNDGTSDPKITAGGVATLIATADNTYALFGSGVQNT